MRITIDPETNIQYTGFYIKGLASVFDTPGISFHYDYFNDIPLENRDTKILRFILKEGTRERHFAIDTRDGYAIEPVNYSWCDKYGKINANHKHTQDNYLAKLIPLCPSFSIRYPGVVQSLSFLPYGLIKTKNNKKKYLGTWRRMLQRPSLMEFCYSPAKDDYIFHLSTLWQSDEWNKNDEGVNLRRAQFIRTCKALGSEIRFDGGLVVGSRKDRGVAQFSDCLSPRIQSSEYLKRIKDSAIVFNTPAYWDCHGWKLGEYMALGKAILSTPLSNDLPAPLIHGEHFHLLENCDESSMKVAIMDLLHDSRYREHLEKGILRYWNQFGTPEASLGLLGIKR